MSTQDREIRQLAVDAPIQNSPYEEPLKYWLYEGGEPRLIEGMRRPAGYYCRTRHRRPTDQRTLVEVTDEQFVELELVNTLRNILREWRKNKWPGVTAVTRQLLEHWWNPEREPRLFFCQLEAAETIIWLAEINSKQKRVSIPKDGLLRRWACKMATGAGKTVVMAMIATWTWLNAIHYPKDKRFSLAILAVCPGLTIKERLQVLRPGSPGNYYDKFHLVPPGMRELLGRGHLHITNWHDFLLRDDSQKRSIVQRGVESDQAFVDRVLHNLGKEKNIIVFNDEAHHAYRPPALNQEEDGAKLTEEEREALKEATVWIQGLDRIAAIRGINFCLDLSATPFYIRGSGHEEGAPFPWIVSDFGLVDAIESGLVKIPRVPVSDTTGQPIPKYFALWRWICDKLKIEDPSQAGKGGRKPKPEAVLREADGAIKQIASLWKASYEQFIEEKQPVPPVLIVVCDNTELSQVVYEHLSGERVIEVQDEEGKKRKKKVYDKGQVFPDLLSNTRDFQPTMRIDSKLIREAEKGEEGKTRDAVGEELRQKVSTVGKVGEPGEQIRCVVSVAMLTEGWDANNVKQILGLRAFDSQLLCEQVVGRGLRRMSYEVDPETGLLSEEYVDVYGVPFEVIPVKKRAEHIVPIEKPKTLVRALEERADLAIEFPRVEGYIYDVGERIRADLEAIPPIVVDPKVEPTEVIARPKAWTEGGPPSLIGPGGPAEIITQTREEYYATVRIQAIEYDLARRITHALVGTSNQHGKESFRYKSCHLLFPQVLSIVRKFLQTKVNYNGVNPKEIGLERYRNQIVERLVTAIEPEKQGKSRLLPRLERFQPKGSTAQVNFVTTRPCQQTRKSHVSHVVLDSEVWERSAAFVLETSSEVSAYVKNDHLGFEIPYEWEGQMHLYRPDFLVRLINGKMVLLEVKGYETSKDNQKYTAAYRWIKAVNNAGQWGHWEFLVSRDPAELPELLKKLVA